MTRAPNLFLIGTQKGGSSSLYEALVTHPEIARLGRKEPNIFCPATEAEARERLESFAPSGGRSRYLLDGSIDYSRFPLYPMPPRNIFRICGTEDVRFLYILRNPVERLISNYFWRMERYGDARPLEEAVKADPQLVQTGLYDLQIGRYGEFFGTDAFHFLLFEDFVEDPRREVSKVLEWLDLDPAGAKQNVRQLGATNKSGGRSARFDWLNRLVWSSPQLKAMAKRLFSDRALRRAARMMTVETQRNDPSLETKRVLMETHFMPSIARTAALTGLDLSRWTQAYGMALPASPVREPEAAAP